MTGYTRQSTSQIVAAEEVTAAPLNAEFNAIQSAMSGSTGHAHDGSTGSGPQINLTTSVTGRLPLTNIATIGDYKVWGNVSGGTTTAAEISILDEDDFVSNSATALATQQSIKAYVGTIAGVVTGGSVLLTTAQTITGLKTLSLGTSTTNLDYLNMSPTDYGVGKPQLYFEKSSVATAWTIGIWDTASNAGILNFDAASLTWGAVTIADISTAQTFTNKTLTAPVLGGTVTGTYTIGGTPTFPSSVVQLTSTQTLTNKTITAPILSGTVTGTYTLGGTPTFPSSVVLLTGSQTLTNKTLTAPVLSGTLTGTYTIGGTPTFPAAVVQLTSTQTLTNKTLTSPVLSGTLTGTYTIGGTPTFPAQIYQRSNVIGTVSQAAGVPTGALTEHSSSSPSSDTIICYSEKHASGLLTQWGKVRLNYNSGTTINGGLTFDEAYVDTNYSVNYTLRPDDETDASINSSLTFGSISHRDLGIHFTTFKTTTNCILSIATISGVSGFASGDTMWVDFIAVGRWF